MRAGILSPIMGKASLKPFDNVVRILKELVDEVLVLEIHGDELPPAGAKVDSPASKVMHHSSGRNPLSNMFNLVKFQTRISIEMMVRYRRADFWVFFMGDTMLGPALVSKLTRRPLILVLGHSLEREAEFFYYVPAGRVIKVLNLVKRLILSLADYVVVYSPNLVREWNLTGYKQKNYIAWEHLIDFNEFKKSTLVEQRKETVGYIGRLSEEKGVLNLIDAIPEVVRQRGGARFMIAGSGRLESRIRGMVLAKGLDNLVEFIDWIPHERLPQYLNELRLFVLPSYTEGLPNLVLEAMACGTPVLASPVGALPDLIIDGSTGFITGDNTPEEIAKNIVRALSSADLESISNNSRSLVIERFSNQATIDRWRQLLARL